MIAKIEFSDWFISYLFELLSKYVWNKLTSYWKNKTETPLSTEVCAIWQILAPKLSMKLEIQTTLEPNINEAGSFEEGCIL